ncbi:MAG: hypothetical protein JXR77_09510, partial [Lentisphaeria bacterium]|nr:hypothetical protein [Lentisphaeria bacterium]
MDRPMSRTTRVCPGWSAREGRGFRFGLLCPCSRVARVLLACLPWGCGGPSGAPSIESLVEAASKGGTTVAASITYPLSGTVFPAEIAPPEIRVEAAGRGSDTWLFRAEAEGVGEPFHGVASVPCWRVPAEVWEKLVSAGP